MGKDKVKILADVDTGVDDSLALLYAINKPEIEIVGITTGCGNTDMESATINTLKILELGDADRNIPVVKGAAKPLEQEWAGPVVHIHGENGLGNVQLPAADRTPLKEDAEDFMYRMAKEHPHDLVIVTLGHLTNVAKTIQKYPDFTGKVKKLVMMGGTIHMRGNISPVAEANVAGDPRACDIVFMSGIEVTAVGLDVTMKTRLTMDHIRMIEKYAPDSKQKQVAYIKKAMKYYMKGNRIQNYCLDDCPVHDPLAMMVALTPGLVRLESRKARVECGGEYCRGMIVTDLREYPFEARDVAFAMEVDDQRAVRELMSAFWME